MYERLFQSRRRVHVRVRSGRALGEPYEIRDRLLGALGVRVMESEAVGDLVQAVGVTFLERLSGRLVQYCAPRREEPTVRDVADPIVDEVELVTHRVEHTSCDELLHR